LAAPVTSAREPPLQEANVSATLSVSLQHLRIFCFSRPTGLLQRSEKEM